MVDRKEHESNLIIVTTVEEYAQRHAMHTKDVWTLFERYQISALLRSQHEVLHMLDLGESTDFVEDVLKRKMEE